MSVESGSKPRVGIYWRTGCACIRRCGPCRRARADCPRVFPRRFPAAIEAASARAIRLISWPNTDPAHSLSTLNPERHRSRPKTRYEASGAELSPWRFHPLDIMSFTCGTQIQFTRLISSTYRYGSVHFQNFSARTASTARRRKGRQSAAISHQRNRQLSRRLSPAPRSNGHDMIFWPYGSGGVRWRRNA